MTDIYSASSCNPQNLKHIKDRDDKVTIIQTELIESISEVDNPANKNAKNTTVRLTTGRMHHFYLAPLDILNLLRVS